MLTDEYRRLSRGNCVCVYSFLYTSEGGRTNPTATLHEGTGYHGSAGLTHELALLVGHAACVRSFSKRVEASQEVVDAEALVLSTPTVGDGEDIHRRQAGRYGSWWCSGWFTAGAVTCPY